jgi:NADPH-dependent glutamate synthase beta subunit-like oxidoreductase
MAGKPAPVEKIPLFISRSHILTDINKTGSWRFVRPIYREKTAPCSTACPAAEDVARIEMFFGQQQYEDALETILSENPFPAVCGRVCFHPCERVCNRTGLDEPVAIHAMERYIGDTAVRGQLIPKLKTFPANGKTVCIIGAGPAGLAAAYFLARMGYSCDMYEAQSEPGGILRWGIPRYRLPAGVLACEIERIKGYGVNIACNTPVTRKFIEDAKSRYHAVFIGCGHGRSLRMNIPGEHMAVDGLEYLNRLRRGEATPSNATAAVIGGGNTAIDVARSLIRQGTETTLLYRRQKQDMPAFKEEVEMAVDEGVAIMELFSPVKIEKDAGEFVLSLQKMKTADMKTDRGRTRVMPDGPPAHHFRTRKIFTAIGAEPSDPWPAFLQKTCKTLYLSHCTLTASNPPFLFGGDLINAVKSVPDAVASGKQAAMAIDIFFKQGSHAVTDQLNSFRVGHGPGLSMARYMDGKRSDGNLDVVSFDNINLDYFPRAARAKIKTLGLDERVRSFDEIKTTLTRNQALKESRRCFNCGICNACDNCRIFCPEIAVILKGGERRIDLDYCKGCGICVVECPRSAMELQEER